jgi:hypothetical protein
MYKYSPCLKFITLSLQCTLLLVYHVIIDEQYNWTSFHLIPLQIQYVRETIYSENLNKIAPIAKHRSIATLAAFDGMCLFLNCPYFELSSFSKCTNSNLWYWLSWLFSTYKSKPNSSVSKIGPVQIGESSKTNSSRTSRSLLCDTPVTTLLVLTNSKLRTTRALNVKFTTHKDRFKK